MATKSLRGSFVGDRLKADIRQQIKKGILKPKDPILSGEHLSKKYKISYLMTHRAISDLVKESLLVRYQGKGTFVAEPKLKQRRKRTLTIEKMKDGLMLVHKGKIRELKPIKIVLSPQLPDPEQNPLSWFVSHNFLVGINKKAEEERLPIYLFDYDFSKSPRENFKRLIQSSPLMGLIFYKFLPGYRQLATILEANKIPYVVSIRSSSAPAKTNKVFSNTGECFEELVEYLIGLGHRKIGLIGSLEESVSEVFVEARQSVLSRHGISVDSGLVRKCGGYPEDGYKAMEELMKGNSSMTAVLASTDLRAIGAMRAIKEKGLRIPEDMSVVGHDDIEEAKKQIPPLTTMRIPLFEMGYESIRLLQELKKMNTPPYVTREIPGKLMIRGSACPPVRRQ